MNKIAIVVQREYLSRVRKKSFILLTFLMPVLFVGLIFGTFYLSSIKDSKAKLIAVADETGRYFRVFQSTDQYRFVEAQKDYNSFRTDPDEAVYAVLVITGDLSEDPGKITLYSHKQVTADLERLITGLLDDYLSDQKLNSYNIPDLKKIIEESRVSVKLQTIKWDEDGSEKTSSADIAVIIGIAFTLIIYMFIFLYGGMVMQGVLEEKTNRIVEVMISSVKPFDLMMGKIIGIGLVGLTQFFLWMILAGILNLVAGSLFALAADPGTIAVIPGENVNSIQQMYLSVLDFNLIEFLGYFIIFFIGGYMIYASLFAAIGAMVNTQEDTQQFMAPVTALVLFAFYVGIYSLENPDGPMAFWTSMFPLTSPIVMMIRLPFDIPLWEKLVSISLLYLTAILMVKLSAKIYRVGILMYGKKPSVKEIIKWLRYY